MSSPHLPPVDPRREAAPREYDEWTDPRQSGEMPFMSHLDELRKVLAHSLVAVALGALASWWLAPIVMQDTIRRTVKHTIFTSPFEPFNERVKLTLILSLLIVLPYVCWRLWLFIVPGLLRRERRWVGPLAGGSYLLFLLGAAAAYFYVEPMVVHLMVGTFSVPGMVDQTKISELMDTLYNLAIACGLLAQLPMVTMMLTAIGLVTPGFLLKQWRIAVVIIFIVTAAITPGDVISAQVLLGVPMVALYFLSVGLSYFVAKKQQESEAMVLSDEPRDEPEDRQDD